MKKVLSFILVTLLVVALAVPAAANFVLSASISKTLPVLANNTGNVKLHNRDDVMKASEDIQNIMVESDKELENADTEGLALRYFFYSEILSGEDTIAMEFEPIPHHEILFMQYIDSMWVQLEHSMAANGVITVVDIVDAPLAIFTDGKASPGGFLAKLVPILTDESYLVVQLHNLEEVVTLSEEIQNRIAEAKDHLKDACPKGFAVKYFFEMEIIGTEAAVSVDFEPIEHNAIVFKQYVDGAWVELEHSVAADGIITVSGLVNGPVATFIK
jgi:hypothetical protein